MRLGVLVDRVAVDPDVVAPDLDDGPVEVDVMPAQPEQLSTAHAGDHHQPNEHPPLFVLLPRSFDDLRGLLWGWWPGFGVGLARLACDGRCVRLDPIPADRGRERGADREVD